VVVIPFPVGIDVEERQEVGPDASGTFAGSHRSFISGSGGQWGRALDDTLVILLDRGIDNEDEEAEEQDRTGIVIRSVAAYAAASVSARWPRRQRRPRSPRAGERH
jgi:hypothetical protein